MKKIISWIMLVAMILGMFAGCGQAADPAQPATTAPVEIPDIAATSENNALDVINYLNAIYKDSGAKTAGDFQRFGIVRIAGVPYTVEWTVDVSADKVTVDVHEDGTVTINVNEKCTEDTPYVLTATVTDGNGNTESATWEYLLPGVASVEEMQAIVDQAYSLEVGEAMTETVSLYGVITSIDTPYSDQYQNISVTIQIEGREDKPILCYRLKGEGAADLNPGDTISVQGIIKNYNNKIEFDAGCTINFVEKTGTPIVIPSDPHQILDDLYALEDDQSLPYGPVTLTGRICSIETPYSEQYRNITVTIIVDWYTVQCYRLKGEGAESLEMNDIITVKGYLKKHGATREFDVPELLDVVKVGEVPAPRDPMKIVETANALDPGWSVPYGEVTLTGIVSRVTTAYSDEYKNITVWMYIDCDVNKQYEIECYRMISNGGENDKKIIDLKPNDLIVVKGVLTNHQETRPDNARHGQTWLRMSNPELTMVATYEEMVVRDAHNKLAAGEKFDDKHYINGSIDLADKQYITGSIKSIDKAYTAADGLTATVVLDYMPEAPVQCINIKGLNADKLKVGDKLTVVGVVSKAADGTVKMGPDCDYIPVVLPATVNPADNKAVVGYASKLVDGQRMVDDTILTGKVTSIDTAFNPKYDNVTLTIDVQGTKIQCYRLKGLDADWVAEGDEIIVGGFLTKYNGKIQFAEGCTFVMLKKGVPAASDANTITFDNRSKRTEFSTEKQVWKENGITVINNRAASYSEVGDYANPARFYKNSSLTIEYPGMMQIVVNCDDFKDTYPTDLINSITGATAVANGTVVTITFTAPVDSFTIPDLMAQIRVDSIKVSTEVTAPETPETPDTPDTPDTGNVYMTSAPKNGDKVVIVAPAYNKALSTQPASSGSYYQKGVNVSVSGTKLTGYADTEVWTVIVNEDGSYSFQNGDQNIGLEASYSSMKLGAVNDDWTLTSVGEGLFNIKNVVRGNFIEWYSSKNNWSTYNSGSAATDDQFQLAFYLVEAAKEPSVYMETAPANGDKVVIVAPAYNKALSTQPASSGSYYQKGVNVSVSGTKLTGYADTEVWTVIVNADGSYSFQNGGQNIGLEASYSSMKLGAVNDDWTLTSLGDGLFNIKNVVRGNFIEWYSSKNNWSTYNSGSAATDDQFQLAFHLVEAGGGSVTPDPEPPVTPDPEPPVTPEATIAGPYKYYLEQKTNNKTLYFTGKMSGNYGAASENKDEGVDVYTETTAEGVRLYFMNGTTKTYLDCVKSTSGTKTYYNLKLVTTPTVYYKLHPTFNIYTTVVEGQEVYLGTYSTYDTFSFSKIDFLSASNIDVTQFPAKLGESGTVTPPVTPDPDPEPPVTPPVTGESQYVKVESAADFTTGKYVMVVSTGYAPVKLDGTWLSTDQPTISGNTVTDAKGAVWTLTVSGTSVTIADSTGAFIKPKGGNNNGISSGSYPWAWAFSNGTFTFKGTGSDTVTLASNTDTTSGTGGFNRFRGYKNTTVSNATKYPSAFTLYKLTEVAAEPELKVSTIKEALAAATGTELKITGYVNMVDGSKVYVQDATGAIRVDLASSGAKNGETFTFTGTKAAGSVLTGTAAEAATPALSQFVTECPLYDIATEVHLYHYMNIASELTIIGEEGDYIIVADDEDNQIKIFDPVCADPSKLVENAVITFKGIMMEDHEGYMTFRNTDASEITIVKEAPAPVTPPAAPTVKYADFDTINSASGSGSYANFSTASGWALKNCAVQVGGPSVANPAFPVVGADKSSKAPCLNGKTSAPGSLTSPTISGGISKLNINYTKMFTDTALKATITITDLSTGTTYTDVLSKTADKNTKYEIWYYEWTLPTTITGDFTISIVNSCPSGNTGNKDRLTILDLFWTTA